MSSEFEDMKASGGPFEPGKLLRESPDPEHVQSNPRFDETVANKLWKDGTENVKSESEPDPLYLHQHVNDLAASERELHEPQHEPVGKGDGVVLEPLLFERELHEPKLEPDDQGDVVQVEPQHEPDDQGGVVQFEPLHGPDDKEHSVNDLIAPIPVSVIDLHLLPQPIDQGGGDVQHGVAEHQVKCVRSIECKKVLMESDQ